MHYLLELIRYIHLNPVRAKLVPGVELYRWSSHHAYRGLNVDRWVTTDFALQMFAVDRAMAIKAYRQFVNCDADEVPSPFDEIHPDQPLILGGEEFVARVSQELRRSASSGALDSLIAEGCNRYGLRREAIESGRRNARVAQTRAWIAREAIARGLTTLTGIARAMNCDPKTIRKALREHAGG